MIKKQLSSKAYSMYIKEQAFMWMLLSGVRGDKFNLYDIIVYWYEQAFSRAPGDSELCIDIIDRIREKLLKISGMKKPILKNSSIWIEIKQSITF